MPRRFFVSFSTLFSLCFFLFSFSLPARAAGLNRIGIRHTGTSDEFYDTTTGQSIVFRGNNYIRCDMKHDPWFCHTTFYKGQYDHNRTAAALSRMRQDGYNAVRVWFEAGGIIDPTTNDFYPEHLDNFVDFLNLATQNKLYVYLMLDGLDWKYRTTNPLVASDSHEQFFIKDNIEGKKRYVQDVINALKTRQAPLSTIMGYGVFNEPSFYRSQAPFGNPAFTGHTGRTYDLSKFGQSWFDLIDDSIVYYVDNVRNAIKQVDPQALVGISIFTKGHLILNEEYERISSSHYGLFDVSTADFVGLNMYSLGRDGPRFEMGSITSNKHKAMIISEFGALRSFFPEIPGAAEALKDTQVIGCNNYHFRGWFYYEYDTFEYDPFVEKIYLHAIEGNSEIYHILSPNYRYNACDPNPNTNPNSASAPPSNPSTITGIVEHSSCNTLSGWAGDTASPNTTLEIHVYSDGTSSTNFVGATSANLEREQAVCTQLGTTQSPCRHGYSYSIPNNLKNGQAHTLAVYGVNPQGPAGTNTSELLQSPITITCNPQTVPGDLNGDSHVDLADYNMLVTGFGNPYTLADYNQLVANFGT